MVWRSSRKSWFTPCKVIIGALLLVSVVTSCAIRDPKPVEGTWVITDAVMPGISEANPQEARQWFGQSYHYGANNLVLGQIQCQSPVYSEQRLNAEEFNAQFNVPLSTLGAGKQDIQAYQISCDNDELLPGQQLFITGHREAYMLWDGVFYKMEKTEVKSQPDNV